ncbi:MAG TPA: serine/threonine-protein kinase [Ktedonobacterales bacterium]|nr:serine/threonine-protein kinase [Ktedonobacterales bacterium]
MNTNIPQRVAIGDRLTDYSGVDVEVKRIASGGFGLLYFGPDRLAGGRWRALKTLRPDILARSKRAYDLFVREGLTWVGLWPHANLLTAEAVTIINNQPFLVLNYAEDGSLRDLFNATHRQGGWLSLGTALDLAQEIAAGLVALHTSDPTFLRPQPLVHRDLKPENVLLDKFGTTLFPGFALITDFGLAKVVEAVGGGDPALLGLVASNAQTADTHAMLSVEAATRSRRYQTARGVALGTLAYMAPEQWEDAASTGPPADVYAFGLILGELFTGYHPLLDLGCAHNEAEWREAHRAQQPRTLASLAMQGFTPSTAPVPDTPVELTEVEKVYLACLHKQAEARPTAAEALARLQQVAKVFGQEPYAPPEVYAHTTEQEVMRWENWASTYFSFGLYQEALERNDRALALAPTDPAVLSVRGTILAKLERREEALTVYDRVLAALSPDDVQGKKMAWNNQGALLSRAGRYAEAEAAYTRALAHLPDAADTWFNRANNQYTWGFSEAQAGHPEASLTHWRTGMAYAERALARNPHHPQFQRLHKELQRLAGEIR